MVVPALVDLDDIAAGRGGFKIQGENADGAGTSVSAAGDVNGDGIDDLIVGAPHNSSGGYSAGAAYVVFGRRGGFTSPIDLADVAGGDGGFKIQGETADDVAGYSVSSAGDVNGDGIDDLIVGAPDNGSGGHLAGAAYVVFGRTDGFTRPVDLEAIAAGSGGFKIQGENIYNWVGWSVSSAGDVNGDSFDDMIVTGAATGAYVVFGRDAGFPAVVELEDIAIGNGGFKFLSESFSVSAAGDVNGDGLDDIIVGDDQYYGTGAAFVIFGRVEDFPAEVDLDDIAAGSGGLAIVGEAAHDLAGSSVSSAGDINGDGVDDLIVGAPLNGSYSTEPYNEVAGAGAAYVVFGRTDGFTSPIALHDIAAGSGGFKIQGENAYDGAGVSVSAAGDVNGDGLGDLIVGAPFSSSGGWEAGAAYVVFGRTDGFASPVDLHDIAAGSGGFKIQGENGSDVAGISVSAAGDVNGDGIDDLIVGAPFNDSGGDRAGAAYVIYGRRDIPEPLFTSGDDSRDLNDVDLTAFTFAQATQALAGDDTVTLSETQNRGRLFYGNAGADTITGSAHGDRIRGDAGGDALLGGGGRDSLWGGAGRDRFDGGGGGDELRGGGDADVMRGGDGDDTAYGSAGRDRAYGGSGDDRVYGGQDDDRLQGGSGDDWLSGDLGHDSLWGGAGDDSLFGRDGRDTLWGGDGRDRLNGGAGADRLEGGADNDRLLGGGGDDLLSGGAGRDLLTGDGGEDVFRYAAVADSRAGAVDRITDFAPGDLVDLSGIDAVAGGADDAFTFIGGGDFTGAGQLRLFVSGGTTFLQGRTGGGDLLLALSGVQAVTEADLVL